MSEPTTERITLAKGLNAGLRRAMAKCGYTDLKSFQKVGLALSR